MEGQRCQLNASNSRVWAASNWRIADLPEREPLGYALFAHCFTCGKDVLAAKRIAVALAAKGIAVLRFDFTGLAPAKAIFCQLHVLLERRRSRACRRSSARDRKAPAILIGHSLGRRRHSGRRRAIPDARAVVTIAAPPIRRTYRPFQGTASRTSAKHGRWKSRSAGRPFPISSEFLDDIANII